ncbi:MAG: AAA family ATPase, partial [Halobacteriota archaeon]
MSQIVVLTGIPGSGKTTVTRKAIEKLEAQGNPFRMVTCSDIMLDEAVQRGWVQARDEIRKLEPQKQRDLQRIAARIIA